MWHERADIQVRFDTTKAAGRRALLRWFLFHGVRESGRGIDAKDLHSLERLHGHFPGLPQKVGIPISWLMFEIARREGLAAQDLQTGEAQEKLLSWVFRKGLTKYSLQSLLTRSQADYLLISVDGVPRLLNWLWQAETDLHTRFVGADNAAFRTWIREEGRALCAILAHPLIDLADPLQRRLPDGRFPFGVNLIGHARARLGVGEDVRMAAQALSAAKIPFVIVDFAAGDNLGPSDDSVEQYLSELLPYCITMFCTTGMETLRAINIMGPGILDRHWTVGFWPWELPEWPEALQHAYADMDEVWASSRYTYDAYLRSSPVPVRHQPMVVSVDESEGLSRADFAFPENRFLFLFAYDSLSCPARKNPAACLAAFDRAFPKGDEPVGLVIKGLRAAGSPAWAAVIEQAAGDPRIILVTDSLSRGKLLDMYRAIDCFVSLHRAEGFGRNIAECMAVGKPVIVTAHSGNMDFSTSETAALVPVRLCTLAPGDYPHGAGQVWAEPDISVAASHMQRMVNDARWRDRLARAGANRIHAQYNPVIVGEAWAKALHELAFNSHDTAQPVVLAESSKGQKLPLRE